MLQALHCRNDEVAEHLGLAGSRKKKHGKMRRRSVACRIHPCILHKPFKASNALQAKQRERQQDKTDPRTCQSQAWGSQLVLCIWQVCDHAITLLHRQPVQKWHGLSALRRRHVALLCRHAEAIVLLLEVIKGAPNLPDAYHTLGLLYEAQGDAEKSVNFFMISAHLSKVQLWLPSPNTLVAFAVMSCVCPCSAQAGIFPSARNACHSGPSPCSEAPLPVWPAY